MTYNVFSGTLNLAQSCAKVFFHKRFTVFVLCWNERMQLVILWKFQYGLFKYLFVCE